MKAFIMQLLYFFFCKVDCYHGHTIFSVIICYLNLLFYSLVQYRKITKPERSEKLFAIVALAFALTVKIGAIAANTFPIPIKKTLNRPAPLYSLFSYGLKYLLDALLNGPQNNKNSPYQCLIKSINASVR
jgi:phosphatidylserine synthase